jgi:DNA-binding GntR family transcriptional regulator
VELELLALQWAKPRVTENDLKELSRQIAKVVEAGEQGDRRRFLELDYAFHRQCWALSGNAYLAETLDRLMAPLFIFVVLASGAPLTASMGREHYELVNALQNTEEPEFTVVVRKRLSGIASRWLAAFSKADDPAKQTS